LTVVARRAAALLASGLVARATSTAAPTALLGRAGAVATFGARAGTGSGRRGCGTRVADARLGVADLGAADQSDLGVLGRGATFTLGLRELFGVAVVTTDPSSDATCATFGAAS
jgi:hypothetical protein